MSFMELTQNKHHLKGSVSLMGSEQREVAGREWEEFFFFLGYINSLILAFFCTTCLVNLKFSLIRICIKEMVEE